MSWNAIHPVSYAAQIVSLFVRLWVEILVRVKVFLPCTVSLFVRLWVEILQINRGAIIRTVSLFVRLWVEISKVIKQSLDYATSASSWGCELKCLYWQIKFTQIIVSLFVRLWVEIMTGEDKSNDNKSASSWGCELKFLIIIASILKCSQPLREAVSWNTLMKKKWKRKKSQPLREAVSWNGIKNLEGKAILGQPLREAVSWNNKFVHNSSRNNHCQPFSQPLREAVSWNI